MKAQSTIEKKERGTREALENIRAGESWPCLEPEEGARYDALWNYWRALRWVLGKDDDEMCLAQMGESGDGK